MNNYFWFAYVIRFLAYLLVALSLVFLIFSEQLNFDAIYLVAFFVLYPHFLYLIETRLPEQKRYLTRILWLVFDSILVGLIIALLNFEPLFMMIPMLPISFFAIVTGGIFTYLFCLLVVINTSFVAFYFLDLSMRFAFNFPMEILWAQTVATLLCTALVGFYTHLQHKRLTSVNLDLKEEQEKSQSLAEQLSKYLAPQVWQMIFSDQNQATIKTERKKLSIFFADIQGFTAVAETLAAEDLTSMLNNYLADIAQIALAHGGTVDKFIGDAVMILFGDFDSKGAKTDALNAVTMAIEIRKHVSELRRKWRRQGIKQELNIRMGINTGFCTVGNFGTEKRMEYTAIGKEVNLASRLENLSELGEILISEETYLLVRNQVLCWDKGLIAIKGYQKKVQVYQVIDFRSVLGEDLRYITLDLPGFSLSLDLEKIDYTNKDQITNILTKTLNDLKD